MKASPTMTALTIRNARRLSALAAAAVLALSGCASAPPPKVVAKPADPCLRTAPAKVWLRGGEVLGTVGGPVVADVWNPLAVELLLDGRIRARDPKGDLVEGNAPELRGTVAGEERGLGLYVQKETPVLLAPGGPEIGRAFLGAYLPVVSLDNCHVEVLLRGFQRLGTPGPFHAFVPADAMGTRERSPTSPPRAPRHVRDHKRTLLAEPGVADSAFAETRCGRLDVLESRKDDKGVETMRVAQAEGSVELRGWVDRPIVEGRGEDRCPVRVLEKQQVVGFDGEGSLPEGFSSLGDGAALAKEFDKLFKKDRTIHIPLLDGDLARCEPFRLRAKGTELVRADQEKVKKPAELWQVRISGGRLTLSGPCRGGGSCALTFLLAGMNAERITLLPARGDLTSRTDKLLAYHQDDTEPWYLEASACESHGTIDRVSSVIPLPQP